MESALPNQSAFNPISVTSAPFVWQPNAAGQPTITPIRIRSFVWSGYTADTDTVVVEDAYGNTIWSGAGYAADFQQDFSPDGWFNGLQVTQLSAGTLQIYLGPKN